MSQNRLSDLAISNVDRELSNRINDNDISQIFAFNYRPIELLNNKYIIYVFCKN